ncbi:MAG: hypothetical protein ACLTSX_11955 [Collinsella sp.]
MNHVRICVLHRAAPMVVIGFVAGSRPLLLLSICCGVQKYTEWREHKAALAAEEAAEVSAAESAADGE